MSDVRVIDQTTDSSLVDGDYVIVDSTNEGTRKYNLGKEISDIKEDLQDLQEEIEGGGGGGGMSADFKQALHNILEKVAFIDDDGQTYLNALDSAMYPPVTAISLNTNSLSFATLNSTQQLTATTTPPGGAVTWSSSNTSIATVSSSGLVTSKGYGSATITATSGSVSATCSVIVAQATLTSISAVYTQSGTVYDTDSLNSLKSDLVVTAHWSNSTTSTVASNDYVLSGTLTEGTSTITVSYGGKTTSFNVTVTASSTILHQSDFTICTIQQDYRSNPGGYWSTGTTRMGYVDFDILTEAGKTYRLEVDWNTTYDLYMNALIYSDSVFTDVENHSNLTVRTETGFRQLSVSNGIIEIDSFVDSAMRLSFKIGSAGTSNFTEGVTYINSLKIDATGEVTYPVTLTSGSAGCAFGSTAVNKSSTDYLANTGASRVHCFGDRATGYPVTPGKQYSVTITEPDSETNQYNIIVAAMNETCNAAIQAHQDGSTSDIKDIVTWTNINGGEPFTFTVPTTGVNGLPFTNMWLLFRRNSGNTVWSDINETVFPITINEITT